MEITSVDGEHKGMRVIHGPVRLARLLIIASLFLFSASVWSCDGDIARCIYADGKFAPFEIKFTTETSAAGLNVDVNIYQRLENNFFDDTWQFRTKITGFVYGIYGSIIDSSEFIILPDNSYRTQKFSRKAKAYGVFPIVPTSFKQNFEWSEGDSGYVRSKYKGDWYSYTIDSSVIDQAILPLQLRMDLLKRGPDLGTIVYKASSKKHVDDDFMVRFVKEVELDTSMGAVVTVIYELLKGQHKDRINVVGAGHDLGEIVELVDRLIVLRAMPASKQRDQQLELAGDQLNALLTVDENTIVSISEDEAKSGNGVSSGGQGDDEDESVIDKASEIEEGNARVFFWLSKNHAYLPVKMLAVIDSNSWSRVVIESVAVDDVELPHL